MAELPDLMTIDLATLPSAVLRRLIAEIRQDATLPARVYDRVHNRHNRGPGPYGGLAPSDGAPGEEEL